MIARDRSLLSVLVISTSVVLVPALRAQTPSPTIEPAIAKLAARLASPLQGTRVRSVIFADLKGPDGQLHPVGKWLADQFSASVTKDFPSLKVIARPQNQDAPNGVDASDTIKEAPETAMQWARSLGADVVVTGTFAKVPDGIGVSLSASYSSRPFRLLSQVNGLVPFSDKIAALSAEPVPSAKGSVAKSGIGGAGVPECIHCPAPNYTPEARAAKIMGTVVLQVTVTPDGRATNIMIAKDPGKGLGMQAVESVRKWKFKPATGPDGKPIAVICPIDVTFHLY
jgi:TonB family protein